MKDDADHLGKDTLAGYISDSVKATPNTFMDRKRTAQMAREINMNLDSAIDEALGMACDQKQDLAPHGRSMQMMERKASPPPVRKGTPISMVPAKPHINGNSIPDKPPRSYASDEEIVLPSKHNRTSCIAEPDERNEW